MKNVVLYFISFLALVIIDFIWLNLLAGSYFSKHLEFLARMEGGSIRPLYSSAVIAYIFMSIGIIHFVVESGRSADMLSIFYRGCLFGAVIYGVFEFMNHSIIDKWPTEIMVLDLAWGTLLCGVTAVVTHFIMVRFV